MEDLLLVIGKGGGRPAETAAEIAAIRFEIAGRMPAKPAGWKPALRGGADAE